MSSSTTDVPLADATGGEETSSVNLDDCAADDVEDAFTEEAEGDNMLSNDSNPSEFVTWESRGTSYQFANNPMRNCVWIMLVLRAVQMGLNFGLLFINPGFLTGMYGFFTVEFLLRLILYIYITYYLLSFRCAGAYNQSWSPGFSSSKANTFITGTQALNNTLPFLIALVADFLIGDYWMIMVLLIVFFIPGSLIITLCAWPFQLGDTFPINLYRIGFQILYTIGNGGIDTIVDIFGAKQFHPIIHVHVLDSYFIWSTVMAGVGGVTAELVYSMIANVNVTASFGLMTIALFISTLLFVYGTKRYVVRRNDMKDSLLTARAMLSAAFCWKKTEQGQFVARPPGFNKVKKSRGGGVRDELVTAARRLALVVPVQGLFLAGNFAFFQMTNLLIPMSYSMKHPTMWTGANMVFVNSSHVVLFGILADKLFYPYLEKRNIHLSTAYRVSIGSCFWALMYLVMLGIDRRLRKVYDETREMISIGWQYFPYAIGALAYVFSMPPQDAITYKVAPSEWKVLGNAVNKFMQQGLTSFISRALYVKTAAWFTPSNGNNNINGIENYTQATSYKFMWICVGFALFQAVLLALPCVDRWYKMIEKYCEARSAE